jgi:hypothetical protein
MVEIIADDFWLLCLSYPVTFRPEMVGEGKLGLPCTK